VTLVNPVPVATREIWPILDVDQSSHSMLLSSFEIGEFSIPIEIRLIEYCGQSLQNVHEDSVCISLNYLISVYTELKEIIVKTYYINFYFFYTFVFILIRINKLLKS